MMDGLWGEEFVVAPPKKDTKQLLDKVKNKKTPKVETVKTLKSNKLSIEEKLKIIYSEVNRILGHYKSDTICIKSRDELHNYISKAIENKIIAIDTETNNSLDPITCKLMGPCIYTPGMKNAYIPINHTDYSDNRLEWQLTENDCYEEFKRIVDNKVFSIYHNGKFDYEVIKCTCNGIEMPIDWDTFIGARVLNENEKRARLKEQYIDKIDSNQEKYNIEKLFEGIPYQYVDPEIFALYSATDPYMTYKLYEWQLDKFNKPENLKLYSLFKNIEIPVVQVAAEMELTGVEIDMEYSKRLSNKYHLMLDEVDKKISEEMKKYDDIIAKWRLTSEANIHPKNKKGGDAKSKNEQLRDPVELTSPTQLAILLYDVLKIPVISKDSPRGTGEDILTKIDLPLCKLILEKRGLEKLIGTYIDKLPECVCKKDGRLHAHFNQYGTDTGRFSSTDPNLQNIPSHNKEIRMMFRAGYTERDVEGIDNTFTFNSNEEVFTTDGWVKAMDIHVGSVLAADDGEIVVQNIQHVDNSIILYC